MSPTLLIRADASPVIGVGHVMRCIALAQAWQDRGGETIFVTACESDELCSRLTDEGFQVVKLDKVHPNPDDSSVMAQVLSEYPDAWVVLDGYHLDPAYQRMIKDAGNQLLVIDDMAHLEHYHADLLLNQNIDIDDLLYADRAKQTKLLLGSCYMLLRREFQRWQDWQRECSGSAHKVLVTLGGGDTDDMSQAVVEALLKGDVDQLESKIIAGPASTHLKSLRSKCERSGGSIQVLSSVRDMPGLMAWADVAVSGGGVTSRELAFMGLPQIVLTLAENQRRGVVELQRAGAAIDFGDAETLESSRLTETLTSLLLDRETRATMSRSGNTLVDGRGAARVVEQMC